MQTGFPRSVRNSAPLCDVRGRVLGKLHGHGCVTQSCCYQSVSVYFYEMGFSSKERKKKKKERKKRKEKKRKEKKRKKPSFRNSPPSLLALRSAMHDPLGAGDKGTLALLYQGHSAHFPGLWQTPVTSHCHLPWDDGLGDSLRGPARGHCVGPWVGTG